jgi:glycosyltransferase involved in cell wall biosynthesis
MEAVPSELILVDTSKSAEIHKILLEYTDQVYEFEWCNDFAKARNVGLKKAKGEWFMFLDDDEWLVDVEDIIQFFRSNDYNKYACVDHRIRNFMDVNFERYSECWVTRLYKIVPGSEFRSKVHEYFAPLDGVKKDSFIDKLHEKYIFLLIRIHEGQFCSLSTRKGLKKIIAAIIKGLPINEKKLADYIDQLIQQKNYENCNDVANYYGHWKEKETINKKIFGQCKRYTFESLSLKGVEQWDNYLTSLYGNYMQLPPKEQQITHADDIYIKD